MKESENWEEWRMKKNRRRSRKVAFFMDGGKMRRRAPRNGVLDVSGSGAAPSCRPCPPQPCLPPRVKGPLVKDLPGVWRLLNKLYFYHQHQKFDLSGFFSALALVLLIELWLIPESLFWRKLLSPFALAHLGCSSSAWLELEICSLQKRHRASLVELYWGLRATISSPKYSRGISFELGPRSHIHQPGTRILK
jgi:hypothetical protein